jgi:hypothetical protein
VFGDDILSGRMFKTQPGLSQGEGISHTFLFSLQKKLEGNGSYCPTDSRLWRLQKAQAPGDESNFLAKAPIIPKMQHFSFSTSISLTVKWCLCQNICAKQMIVNCAGMRKLH